MMSNNLELRNKGFSLNLIRKCLDIVLLVSIIGELIFFSSWANFTGCVMELIVWLIFRTFFLKKKVVIEHPFSFLAFSSIFLARYIPLPATLIEAKPITYGFENPFETFLWETIMFIFASASFYAVIYKKKRKNNNLQRTLYRLNFFKTNAPTLWILGFIGLFARIINLAVANEVQYGDAGNKFLDGFLYLQFAPIIMLFPTLSGISHNKRRNSFVWLYTGIMFALSFAANSRQQMIYPIFTIILLFILYLLKENISIFNYFTPVKIMAILFVVFFGLNFLSDISIAMLANRSLRSNISRTEILNKTIETMQNDELMQKLRNISVEDKININSYNSGWDETYLDNFMLNRYGNTRVVDQTIYYANIVGFGNEKMQESFFSKTIATYPLPILSLFGIELNKNDFGYSAGDILYWVATGNHAALGGFRVTSFVGDGLATFGYICFPIAFILLFLSFKLMDSLVLFKNNSVIFSTLGLINIFGFLGMFRNSIGFITPLSYILRGFWQQCFTFWLIVFIIKQIPIQTRRR